jgi:hypothetical protein
VKLKLSQAASLPTPRGTPLPADLVRTVTGYYGRTYVQFPSKLGVTYLVQYRDSANDPWNTSFVSVLGTGEPVSWMDNGQPKTSSAPTPFRSYQVLADPQAP